jgi:hypothetical protein
MWEVRNKSIFRKLIGCHPATKYPFLACSPVRYLTPHHEKSLHKNINRMLPTRPYYSLCHHRGEVATMDFDIGSFFEVENIISAIFNGVPLFPDQKAAQMLPPMRSAQGSPDESVSSAFTPTLTSTSTSSLGKTISNESPLSLSTRVGDKQVRSDMPPPPLPKSDKPPSLYMDSAGQLLLAPGELHLSYDL